jgi:hypothetical protein
MKFGDFYITVYFGSPVWTLALPFISANRIYRWASYAVCVFFFAVSPTWTSIIDHASDGGLGMLLSVGVSVLAALFAVVLLVVNRKRHHRIYFGVMLGSAVVGILGAFAVRM